MARPPTILDEDILTAARAVLLERGLGATAAHVAERAGISEGSVFHRFKTKEALFAEACFAGRGPHAMPEWLVRLDTRVGKGTVEGNIEEIAHDGIGFFRLLIPFVMLSWSKGPREHGPGEPPPLRALKAVAAYFEAEMSLGRLERHDPEVVARAFTGALWNFVSMELMFESRKRMPLADVTFVRGFTRLLLEGMGKPPAVSSEPPTPPRNPRVARRKG